MFTVPSTSSKLDSSLALKRRARESLEGLLKEHHLSQKRQKPDTNVFLEQYKSNLKTFSIEAWATSEINPRELAQRGWRELFRHADRRESCVECSSCQKKMSPEVAVSQDDDLVMIKSAKSIRKEIADLHHLTCVFRSIKVDFHELYWNYNHVEQDLTDFSTTYNTPLLLEHNEEFDKLGHLEHPGHRDHLILACLYWKMTVKSWGSINMHCGLCNRECLVLEDKKFDAVRSHRWFCPLLDVVNGVAVWQRRIKILTNKSPETLSDLVPSTPAAVLQLRAARLIQSGLSSLVKA